MTLKVFQMKLVDINANYKHILCHELTFCMMNPWGRGGGYKQLRIHVHCNIATNLYTQKK